jgi:Viral A-type inclusion protein repeat
MARALLGHVGSINEHQLVFEVARLRRRIAELESELAELRATARVELDQAHIEAELHRLAEAEPALA